MADKAEKREDNQEDVASKSSGNKSSKGKAILAIAVVAILVIAGLYVLSSQKPEQRNGPSAAAQVVDVNMTTVAIPLGSISQTAIWYE